MTSNVQTTSLGARVRTVWQRRQRNHLGDGFLTLVRWGIPLFLAGMTIDWLADLPAFGRLVLLAVIIALPVFKAWTKAWHKLGTFNASRTAITIEEKEGGLESLLATAVELEENGPTPGTSASLWEATRRQAEEAAKDLNPVKLAPFGNLARPALLALLLGSVILVFGLFNGAFLQAGLNRIFNPWSSASYPTNTIIGTVTETLVIKQGERATLDFSLSGEVPDSATLLLKTGNGDPREIEIEVKDDKCQYLIASASRDFSYRVEAGDAKTSWLNVRVIPAPRLANARVDLEFPVYLDRENETLEALTLTVPESTKVHWDLTLDQAVHSAVLHRDDGEPVALEVLDGGTRIMIDESVEASRGYSFSWVEKSHGFEFESPRYFLQVSADQPPQVEITGPENNLNALLGRELKLAVRANDDHGIGSTKIIYRVNLRPEKTIDLDPPVQTGRGEQVLDWDYRTALPGLKVGDTVSFVVEVSDRYPGPDGPHLARSDTRRLTFLSREDYLAQILRKQDRLLTRVRNIYRQERSAHELVRALNPSDAGFPQTCQLEAIRQEMLREQLKETALGVQMLLDDLAANGVSEAVEKDTLVEVKQGIETIADGQIAEAAGVLRALAGQVDADPRKAAGIVNSASRELAGLVLLRGIDSAREVFARETRMLAGEQALLRLTTVRNDGNDSTEELVRRHQDLSKWTGELVTSLRNGMRYEKRPIAVLHLTRRIKDLASSGVIGQLAEAGKLIESEKRGEAANLQSKIIHSYLAAEFSMRTGAEYAAIMSFRKILDQIQQGHTTLQARCQAMKPDEFSREHAKLAALQAALRDELLPALLPPVPAMRPQLYDQTLPQPPPVDSIRLAIEEALHDSFLQLSEGKQQAALSQQIEATQSLRKLDKILEASTVELGLRTSGLTSLVSRANEIVAMIEDFEARQISLLEKTEEAALDEVDSSSLSEPQDFLASEVALLIKDLTAESQSSPEILPLLARLKQTTRFLDQSTSLLKSNKGEDALGQQEQTADLLAGALEVARGQVDRLSLLQDLFGFQRAVGNASGWMRDIVAEQKDLITATKSAKENDSASLIPLVKNLRQCLTDIAPVLDLVAGRLDAGTPLLFAGTDLEDAVLGIEDGDFLDAEDAQMVAAESLEKVQRLVSAVELQTSYTAEIVGYLHQAQAEATLMAFRQEELRQRVLASPDQLPDDLAKIQTALKSQADTFGKDLVGTTGMSSYQSASIEMEKTLAAIPKGNREEIARQMEAAGAALATNSEELFLIITMLHGLPSIEINTTSEPALVLLLDVLAIASDQRKLSRQTESAPASGLSKLSKEQARIQAATTKIIPYENPNLLLTQTNDELQKANESLVSLEKSAARIHQETADRSLRHYVIEQALILETAVAPPSSSDEPVLSENETDDLYESTANFVSDFVSGEAPKDKRTEWEVLGNRNRAALNQNFARELPLEYRATLKNYYERVAK